MSSREINEAIRAGSGCAIIVAGSDSDGEHVRKIAAALKGFGIPYELRVCSAHKSPQALLSLLEEYERLDGALVYVAVAGGTDALSGTLSFHALHPVVACPPDRDNSSCLGNPPGSSNAVIFNPKNVGRFIAQMFAAGNPRLRQALRQGKEAKVRQLEQKDQEFRKSI